MGILSYILTFALGIIAGMALCALLRPSRQNIDESQGDKFVPDLHDEVITD